MGYEIIGWAGALLFIVAYLLLTLQKISANRFLYHFLNIMGAVCLIFHAWYLHDFPNIVVNGIWGLIALFAIWNITYFTKK